jgi:FdhE protein
MPYDDQRQAGTARRSGWEQRIRRAAELAERYAYAAEVLGFYQYVLELQGKIFREVSSPAAPFDTTPGSLRQQLDPRNCIRYLPALLELVQRKGTEKLKQDVRRLAAVTSEKQQDVLDDFLASPEDKSYSFFARALFQPYAESLARAYPAQPPGSAGSVCPICGGRPQAAVLRPEGDGGKRYLLCSFCLTEWEFRRVLCPSCGDEDHQKLPRYSAEDVDGIRVEACDTCHSYLKSVDMTVDGRAVPLVDEVAFVTLDLWATEHGYKKVQPNLMGF